MAARLCPTCRHPVLAEDVRCGACGADLRQEDTIPSSFDSTPRSHPAPPPQRHRRAELTPRPIPGTSVPVVTEVLGSIDLLIEGDPPAPAPVPAEVDARRTAKTERRASVRRARMHRDAAPGCTDVLVLDADETTRGILCGLLAGFGFQLVVATDIEQATAIAASRRLAAAFVDIRFDRTADNAAIALCRAIKASRTALVLISAGVSPVDRIRAELAGCDTVIAKPARRGELARALEACTIALPADARRA